MVPNLRRRPNLWILALSLLLVALGGCASRLSVQQTVSREGIGWPAEDPRIWLDRIIALERATPGTSSRILAWIAEDSTEKGAQVMFGRPHSVDWYSGQYWLVDPETRRLARISTGGQIKLASVEEFDLPIGIAVCALGVVVTDSRSGRVGVLDHDLSFRRWLIEGLERPTGVDCDDERVFVSETGRHRILVVEPDGTTRALGERGSEPGQFNFPTVLALGRNELIVGDSMNFRLQRFDPRTGDYLGGFGQLGDRPGDMPRIKGVAVDGNGNIWVADGLLDQVSIYDIEGRLLLSLGGTGSEPGQFSFPAGIASNDRGEVAVVDSLNRRIQVFDIHSSSGQ